MEESKVYTIPEVAEMLRIDPTTVSRLIHRGKINAYKIGKLYRIPKIELDRFLYDTNTNVLKAKKEKIKKRVSLEGIFNDSGITDKDLDEATKIWTSRELP